MSESESEGALTTLFFYVLFVHPVCAWILAPKRFRKDRAIVYAILFLATIALGKMVGGHLGREGVASPLLVANEYYVGSKGIIIYSSVQLSCTAGTLLAVEGFHPGETRWCEAACIFVLVVSKPKLLEDVTMMQHKPIYQSVKSWFSTATPMFAAVYGVVKLTSTLPCNQRPP